MDILGKRKIWYSFSSALIVIGLIFLIFQGLNFGIDFLGGTLLEFGFDTQVSNEEARSIIEELGYEEIVVRQIVEDEIQGVLISMQELDPEEMVKIENAFQAEYPSIEVLRTTMIGPAIGRELMIYSLWALLLASIAIIIYVSVRFEFRFAIVAIITLLHDVLITIGLFALLGREVNTAFVAALLTILGYSINDTIVIFDRIRENMKLYRNKPFIEQANTAVVDTLPRSINTSMTTLLAILAMYLFGGPELQTFMLALFIGMAAGTYSSIFVASPLLVTWQEKFSPAKR
ncbi:protein translocase subunit SecF [Natronospora cellulosivora (SeqCode)]